MARHVSAHDSGVRRAGTPAEGDGLKFGVTALSHKVIGGVLSEVGRPAVQKCGEGEF